jgi:hypothetical protein
MIIKILEFSGRQLAEGCEDDGDEGVTMAGFLASQAT